MWRYYPELISFSLSEENVSSDDGALEKLNPEIIAKAPEELSNVAALLERGENFFEDGFLSLAISDFSRAIQISPNSKKSREKLILAQTELRDYKAAEKTAYSAIQQFPNDLSFQVLLGKIQIHKSEFENAVKTFENLPDSAEKDFHLGVMAVYYEDYENAILLLQSAHKNEAYKKLSTPLLLAFEEFGHFPDGNILHQRLLLAKAMNDLKFFELSVEMTKEILKKREDYRDAYIVLGHSYLSLQRPDMARMIFQRAFELDSTKPETTFFLALAESAQGDYTAAVDHFEMARENGYEPIITVTKELAEANMNAKFYEAARKEYERILQLEGSTPEMYARPIEISLTLLNEKEYALALAQQAIKQHPTSEIAKNLYAWTLIENAEFTKAKGILTELLQQNPNFAPGYLNLGRISEKEGDIELAIQQYKAAYELSPHTSIGALAAEKYNAAVYRE